MTARTDPPTPEIVAESAQAPARTAERSRLLRVLSGLRTFLRRLTGFVVLVLFAASAYLTVAGFPKPLVRKWTTYLRERGLEVEVGGVKLDVLNGIVVEDFSFYDAPGRPFPMLEANRVTLGFNPLDWTVRHHGLRGLHLKGAVLRINVEGDSPEPGAGRDLVLEKLDAWLRVEPDGFRLNRLTATLLGIRVRGQGMIHVDREAEGGLLSPAEVSEALSRVLQNLPEWLPSITDRINALIFATPPKAVVNFALYPSQPEMNEASVKVTGFGTGYQGASVDQWRLDALLESGKISPINISLLKSGRRCDITGSYSPADRMTEFRLFNAIPPSKWMPLLPAKWQEWFEKERFAFEGPGTIEVWGGPAPINEVSKRMSGWASLEKALLGGVWLEKGFASFELNDSILNARKFELAIGKGQQRGVLKGEGRIDLEGLEYQATAKTDFNPKAVFSLLTPNQRKFVADLHFPASNPRADIAVSGRADDSSTMHVVGQVSGEEFSFRDVDVQSFRSNVLITNGILGMESFLLVRREGQVEGSLTLDFDSDIAEVDLVSTADPYSIGRIISLRVEKFLRKFRVEGPVRVAARGRVDYGKHEDYDIEANVQAQKVGWKWLMIDRGSFNLDVLGTRVDFTDVEGITHDGTFSGTASIYPVNDTDNLWYEIDGSASDVNFRTFVQSCREVDGDPYEGNLSVRLKMRGMIGEGRGNTAVGEGSMIVEKGHLFQIPLLGGLSQLLSRLYPRLGFATQTEFRSDIVIEDGMIRSREIDLQGAILSLKGSGDYHLDGKLDMNIEVRLLREGPIAAILRLVTFPVTKLLEFHLGGTATDPKWRPVNLPKELFLIFD